MKEQKIELTKQLKQLKQYIPLISLLISIIGLLVLLVKFFIPETISIKARFEKLNDDKSRIIKLEKKNRILSEFKQKKLINLIEKSKLIIPANENLGSSIVYLRKLAIESNVAIAGLSLQSSDAQSDIFSLEIAGGKEGIFNFLRSLSKPDKRILISDNITFNIGNKTGSQEENTYFVDLTIVAPYSPFPDNIVAVSDEIPELTNEERNILEEIAQITLETSNYEAGTPVSDFEPRDNPFEF